MTGRTWDPSSYGDAWATKYDQRFAGLSDTQPAVEVLAELSRGGRILELGVGTGRLAIPLAERGHSVVGLDASEKMLQVCRSKVGARSVELVAADFTDFDLGTSFHLIYMSCNTFFDLPTQSAQLNCLRSSARHLATDGLLVLELSIPRFDDLYDGKKLKLVEMADDGLVFDCYEHDRNAQVLIRQRSALTKSGLEVKFVRNRYVWPAELDLMAQIAGLSMKKRFSGWERRDFGNGDTGHVSLFAPRNGG